MCCEIHNSVLTEKNDSFDNFFINSGVSCFINELFNADFIGFSTANPLPFNSGVSVLVTSVGKFRSNVAHYRTG